MTTLPDQTPAENPSSPVDKDVVVVGGGAAGLSAAVFLARYGMETLVFARGKSAIHQCAHLENYLGFPGGISPERFVSLGRSHAEEEGATVVTDHVESVLEVDEGFRVETQGGDSPISRYVLAASAYDGEYLESMEDNLDKQDDPDFVTSESGRTSVEGLYAAGWMTDETAHQAIINAGHGARAALSLVRDDIKDRYWSEVGETYVDWVVDDDRYGGDDWDEHIDEWFEREILPPDEDIGTDAVEAAREDLKSEFLDRCVEDEERKKREREGQLRLLEHLDDDTVLEYAQGLRSTVDR